MRTEHKNFLQSTAVTLMNIQATIESLKKTATDEKEVTQLNFLARQYKNQLTVVETMVKNQ